ncbi:MAG: metal-dependent hydrolase [Eggerthellaceae bacterium]|nr:metal-dependent hydrolase [Eggerthellaceae bacterium]
MMSKTHIAVGVASAIVIAQTGSAESCVAAMIGGSIGGIIADCDITPSRAHKDALIGRIIVIAVSVVSLAIDYWYGAGVCDYLVGSLGVWLIVGIVLFAALTFVGGHTDHRSFTHSLVGMAAFCGSFYLICEPLLPYFVIGYASHLVLDITNKQGIQLFWPFKANASLGLCRAKGVANTVVLVLGIAVAALLLAYRLAPLFGVSIGVF